MSGSGRGPSRRHWRRGRWAARSCWGHSSPGACLPCYEHVHGNRITIDIANQSHILPADILTPIPHTQHTQNQPARGLTSDRAAPRLPDHTPEAGAPPAAPPTASGGLSLRGPPPLATGAPGPAPVERRGERHGPHDLHHEPGLPGGLEGALQRVETFFGVCVYLSMRRSTPVSNVWRACLSSTTRSTPSTDDQETNKTHTQ